jgi:hypothetical protein
MAVESADRALSIELVDDFYLIIAIFLMVATEHTLRTTICLKGKRDGEGGQLYQHCKVVSLGHGAPLDWGLVHWDTCNPLARRTQRSP